MTGYPAEALRLKLAALGIPRERQRMDALLALLPAPPFTEFDADTTAEVVLYLAGKGLIDVSELPQPALQWGEHLRQVYRSQEELVGILAPYFAQGLKLEERCIWVVSGPLTTRQARAAVERLVDCSPDQLEVREHDDEYAEDWSVDERRALAEGYRGLRVSMDRRPGKAPCVPDCGQRALSAARRIKSLCTYPASPAASGAAF